MFVRLGLYEKRNIKLKTMSIYMYSQRNLLRAYVYRNVKSESTCIIQLLTYQLV